MLRLAIERIKDVDTTCKTCTDWNSRTAECNNPTQLYETFLHYKMNLFVEFDPLHYGVLTGYNYSCASHKSKSIDDQLLSQNIRAAYPLPRDGIRREIKYPRDTKPTRSKFISTRQPIWPLENMFVRRLMTRYSVLYKDKCLYQWSIMLDYPERLRITSTSKPV